MLEVTVEVWGAVTIKVKSNIHMATVTQFRCIYIPAVVFAAIL